MSRTIYTSLQGLSELFLMFSYPISSVLALITRLEKTHNRNSRYHPIVIYEQWFIRNSMHILMKKYLERKGFSVYWTNYSIFKGGYNEGAKYLHDFIEKNNLHDVVLVGISMGGLGCLEYLQNYNGWNRVNKFISVGSPFKGTPWATFISFSKAGRQTIPNSQFIRHLFSCELKNPERIISLYAHIDQMVPSWSSRLHGVKNRVIHTNGHNNLHVISKSVLNYIAQNAR